MLADNQNIENASKLNSWFPLSPLPQPISSLAQIILTNDNSTHPFAWAKNLDIVLGSFFLLTPHPAFWQTLCVNTQPPSFPLLLTVPDPSASNSNPLLFHSVPPRSQIIFLISTDSVTLWLKPSICSQDQTQSPYCSPTRFHVIEP